MSYVPNARLILTGIFNNITSFRSVCFCFLFFFLTEFNLFFLFTILCRLWFRRQEIQFYKIFQEVFYNLCFSDRNNWIIVNIKVNLKYTKSFILIYLYSVLPEQCMFLVYDDVLISKSLCLILIGWSSLFTQVNQFVYMLIWP